MKKILQTTTLLICALATSTSVKAFSIEDINATETDNAIIEINNKEEIVQHSAKTIRHDVETPFVKEHNIQTKIDNIGTKILNTNKIERRIIFTYSTKKKPKITTDKTITKRQIIYYDEFFKYTENDDEIAALLSREISKAVKSFDGAWGGIIDSAQIKMAPKKYEIYADKRAVDYMVNAGYNPLGLITFIHKTYPQKRNDKFSYTNLTSKRLAIIYEYIFTKYPQFLVYNDYLNNETYQNFLLTSANNRLKLQQKIKSGSKGAVHYE